MTDREVMQMALEVLESLQGGCTDHDDGTVEAITVWCPEVIDALRAALEQPEQQAEPVAWAVYDAKHGGSKTLHWPEQHSPHGDPEHFNAVPLYASPPQRKPLTDEDIEQAQRTVWRSLPSDFDYTTSSWIEIGIRYAEAAHGIKETP